LLYLNDGAWPPTPAETRLAEAKKACELLGARPSYAGQKNGAAIVDNIHYEDFAKRLDAEAPDAVFTHWMVDNHRDHRAIAMLSYDAWQKSGRKFALYYYEVSDGEDTLQFSPNRYVDIARMEPRKKAACYAHASQTPDRYYDLQDRVARFRGPRKRLYASGGVRLATTEPPRYPRYFNKDLEHKGSAHTMKSFGGGSLYSASAFPWSTILISSLARFRLISPS
jgi:LmbE family N-acetylglucosaminyl deacetylase